MKPNPAKEKKVLGIFQHSEALDIHFFNMALDLSKHFEVHAFLFNQKLESVQLIDIARLSDVSIHNLLLKDHLIFWPRRVLSKLRLIEKEPLFLQELGYLIRRKNLKFDFAIGVEKKGLALMNQIGTSHSTRKLYYSLELYEKSPYSTDYDFDNLRRLEQIYHSECDTTIIQDRDKATSIARYNNLIFDEMKWIYLPVSVKGKVNDKPSNWLHDQFKIHRDRKIILNFGMLSQQRYSVEVASVLNELDKKFQPVLHGYGDQAIMDQLQVFDRIIVSQDRVREEELNKLIASAYIGISIYNNEDDNNKLTILSSERNARYCQNGVPFICLYNDETNNIYKELKFFEMVRDLKDIPSVLKKIHARYSDYRQSAFKAFDRYYSFDNNFRNLLTELR